MPQGTTKLREKLLRSTEHSVQRSAGITSTT